MTSGMQDFKSLLGRVADLTRPYLVARRTRLPIAMLT